MKPNSAFPEEVSKCILLMNFLLPTSCQGCRPMRAPSAVLGSSADTAAALHWGHMAAECASLERGQLGMSVPAPAPVCFPNRRAWSANQSWASFTQRWKSGQQAHSTGEENKHQLCHQHITSAQPWPQPGEQTQQYSHGMSLWQSQFLLLRIAHFFPFSPPALIYHRDFNLHPLVTIMP